jgi:hypothetical protein
MEPEISNIFRETEMCVLKNNRSSPQENLCRQSWGKGGLVVIKMINEEERQPSHKEKVPGWLFFAEFFCFEILMS